MGWRVVLTLAVLTGCARARPASPSAPIRYPVRVFDVWPNGNHAVRVRMLAPNRHDEVDCWHASGKPMSFVRSDPRGVAHAVVWDRSGTKRYESVGRDTGGTRRFEVHTWHPNGAPSAEIAWACQGRLAEECTPSGSWTLWHPNGRVRARLAGAAKQWFDEESRPAAAGEYTPPPPWPGSRAVTQSPLPYPSVARDKREHGDSIVVVLVGPDGSVQHLGLVQVWHTFVAAIQRSVLKWTYEPLRIDGTALDHCVTLRVQFRLRSQREAPGAATWLAGSSRSHLSSQ